MNVPRGMITLKYYKAMQVSVHFSKISGVIAEHLSKAEKEIKVAVAWLTDEDLIRILALKSEAGLDVQVAISDSKENFKLTSNLGSFIRNGGKLFVSTKTFLHHKFCVV